jgi:hypothetical protein
MVRTCRLPSRELGEPYYLQFEPGSGIYSERWTEFDANGVLYNGAYNSVSIAQYALHCYDKAHAGDRDARAAFLCQAAYLREAQHPDGSYPYAYGHADFCLGPGWISAMSQGEACSVFLRAFALTKDQQYLDCAIAALKPLEYNTEAGGATYMSNNDTFFEEVAGMPTHILNGHLCAAFAVWEACEYGIASRRLQELHEAAIDTLVRWLPLYDDRGWSFYDLGIQARAKRHYVPITYHQTHIVQLRVYAAMTGREEFAAMANRWEESLQRWDVRARVWSDGAKRLAESAFRRMRKTPNGPWRVLHGTSAEH